MHHPRVLLSLTFTLLGCGSSEGGAMTVPVDAGDGVAADAGPPPACPAQDLGSTTGDAVATGNADAARNRVTSSCGGGSGTTATFLWTAPSSGTFNFSTVGSNYDTVLSVLASASCAGPEIGCNDDQSTDVTSRVDATLVSGDQVVVAVHRYGGETGDYVLSIWEGLPANEAGCADGADEDRDGLTDCQDDDCAVEAFCVETDCTNTLDDDGDGYTDCEDTDCDLDETCF